MTQRFLAAKSVNEYQIVPKPSRLRRERFSVSIGSSLVVTVNNTSEDEVAFASFELITQGLSEELGGDLALGNFQPFNMKDRTVVPESRVMT